MAQQAENFEVVRYKLRDLHEQRNTLMELVIELLQQMQDIERQLAILYDNCREAND